MLAIKKNVIPVLIVINSLLPHVLRAQATLLWPPQTLFEVMLDIKKIGNEYTHSLIEKIKALPKSEISEEIAEKAHYIKKENLTLQIMPIGAPIFRALDPHEPLHIYLSKAGTPKKVAIDLGKINPTTEHNRFKKPQMLLLEVMKGIETHLKLNNLKIPQFDKFRYKVISDFKKYDSLQLDSKFPFKIDTHYHYLDVSQVKTLRIGMSPSGDITINGLQVGENNSTPQKIAPQPKEDLLYVKQDNQHPEAFAIYSEDGNAGAWLNIKKIYPGTSLLEQFQSISEALAQ